MVFTGKLVFEGILVSYVVNGIELNVENLTDNSLLSERYLEHVQTHVLEMHDLYTVVVKELHHGIN